MLLDTIPLGFYVVMRGPGLHVAAERREIIQDGLLGWAFSYTLGGLSGLLLVLICGITICDCRTPLLSPTGWELWSGYYV